MPCFRDTSVADNPAACSFSTLMICSSVNLLLRMSVSHRKRTLPNTGGRLRGAGRFENALSDAGPRRVERVLKINQLDIKPVEIAIMPFAVKKETNFRGL